MQNFNVNDIMGMMQQFGMNGGMQRYMQAFQQMQSQGMPQDMFQAYQQFRKNLGMQGDISPEQFKTMQNQMNNMPQEQLNQVKSMVNQGTPNKTFNGGF
uniref:Uncharacterized protein n=1 Tax=Siphoviridae sp. ctYh54 TaxID=2826379 RepID=A0A8S5MED0_9CAUD|nr:MAG TPA: hypothetical protein [Siphoviridae sp. ctYh54]